MSLLLKGVFPFALTRVNNLLVETSETDQFLLLVERDLNSVCRRTCV